MHAMLKGDFISNSSIVPPVDLGLALSRRWTKVDSTHSRSEGHPADRGKIVTVYETCVADHSTNTSTF